MTKATGAACSRTPAAHTVRANASLPPTRAHMSTTFEAVQLPNAAFGRFPPHLDEPGAFQPVQHWVKGSVGDFERTVRLLRQLRDDLVPVGLARPQQVQHDELERPAPQLARDALPVIGAAATGA